MTNKLTALAKQLCPDPRRPEQGLRANNGSWLLQKRIDGRRINITGKDPVEVWNRYAETMTAAQDAAEEAKQTEEYGPLFSDMAAAYRAKVEQMRGGTQRCYLAQIQKASARFGQMRMKQIDRWDVKDWIDGMSCSASTASNIKIVLSKIFELYCDSYRESYNPVKDVRLEAGKAKAKRLPPPPVAIEALKASADDPEALTALILLCTGCRLGEAVGLQVRDIDFEHHRIAVCKAVEWLGNTPHITLTKTEAGMRTVPLVALLGRQLERFRGKPADTYIIGGETEPVTHTWHKRHWDALWHKLGFAHEVVTDVRRSHNGKPYTTHNHRWVADVTPHQFRHAYVTILCESGVPETAAIQIVGHADQTMIHEVYYHISQQMIASAADRLNGVFGS